MRATPALLAELLGTFFVSRQFRHAVKTALEALDQVTLKRCLSGRDSVMVPQTVLARTNQSSLAKIRQVPRRGGLRDLDDSDDVAHAKFATEQETQNPQAGAVREGPEHQVNLGFGFLHYIRPGDYSERAFEE